jgi:hypothetical protein
VPLIKDIKNNTCNSQGGCRERPGLAGLAGLAVDVRQTIAGGEQALRHRPASPRSDIGKLLRRELSAHGSAAARPDDE